MEAAATAEHCVMWADDSCGWVVAPSSHARRFARTIRWDNPVEIEFLVPPAQALSVGVRFGTWTRRNTAAVICRLVDPSGAVLRESALEAPDIRDGAFHTVADLRGLTLERGCIYRCHLSSPRGTDEDGFAVFFREAPLRLHAPDRRITHFRNQRSYLYRGRQGQLESRRSISAVLFPGSDDRAVLRSACEIIQASFPSADIDVTIASSLEQTWDRILELDVAFLTDTVPLFDSFCLELQRLGVCTICLDVVGLSTSDFVVAQNQMMQREAAKRRCRFGLSKGRELVDHAPYPNKGAVPGPGASGLSQAAADVRGRWMPSVTVVSRLPDPEVRAQDWTSGLQAYPGRTRLVLIGKASEPPDVAAARGVEVVYFEDWHDAVAFATHQAEASDLIVLCSEGGRLAPDFLAAHAFEHRDAAAAAVFGRVLRAEDLQSTSIEDVCYDPVTPAGFLNCTCRNMSLPSRRTALLEGFLEAMSLDDAPARRARELECAYDAYCSGETFRYSDAASLMLEARPVVPPMASQDGIDPFGLRDLERSRPSFAMATRRWLRTAPADADKLTTGSPRERQELRILSYRWHVPHQYELYKLPHRFTLATGIGENRFIDEWAFSQRPLRANVEMCPIDRIDPTSYDLAILHFDENIFATNLSNGALNASWGDPFAHLLDLPEIPKIAICHGTPPFVGQFAASEEVISRFEVHEMDRRRLVEYLKRADARVVVNSRQALIEWGFYDARVIWHGFDPLEFPPSSYERQVLAHAQDAGRPHYRGAHEMREVRAALNPHIAIGELRYEAPPLEVRATNAYAARSFAAYVDAIGKYTVYLNTTLRSPMPRSRGEAMMTGVAPICLRNHDVEHFITQGVDGFFADEPGELADFINHVFRVPNRARRLGEAARAKALDVFNHDRFLDAWAKLIAETV